eukprot:6351351-Prymnesium_polylepis.1
MRIAWSKRWALGDTKARYLNYLEEEEGGDSGSPSFGDSSVQNVEMPPEAGWTLTKMAVEPPPSLSRPNMREPVSPPGAPKGAPKGQFHLSKRMLSAAQASNVEGMQQVRAARCTYACLVRS